MPAARHTPKVLEKPPKPGRPEVARGAAHEDLRAALDIILAAAANLRHYRERLSAEEHREAVRDIEQAAERIAAGFARGQSPSSPVMTTTKRRTR